MEKIKSNFLEQQEIRAALDVFVQFGVLLKVKKDNEDAWVENPDFNTKTSQQQAEVFEQTKTSTNIPTEVLKELSGS